MPKMDVDTTAKNIVADQSLTDGTSYTIQNVGGRHVRFAEAAAAPTDALEYFVLAPAPGDASWAEIEPASSTPIWFKTDSGGSVVVYAEA